MKNKLGFWLLLFLILGILFFQVESLVETLVPTFSDKISKLVSLAKAWFYPAMYILISLLIWIERKRLSEFHLDKFSVLTFLVFMLTFFLRESSLIYLLMVAISAFVISRTLKSNDLNLQPTNIKWGLVGLFVGLASICIIFALAMIYRTSWTLLPLIGDSFALSGISQVIYELSKVPLEEIMYRGFLVGYLRQWGLGEKQSFFVQCFLFWLGHVSRLVTPFTFFVAIPVLAIVCSLLTQRAKQVFPSTLAHTALNTVGAVLNMASF